MSNRDPRVDNYILKSAQFAQPILIHIRELVHQACPGVKETLKWGMPFFDYKGPICNIASFKQHCAFGFWKASLMSDPHELLQINQGEAMGQFGQIKSLEDLPKDDILIQYIQEATLLNEKGIKVTSKRAAEEKIIETPDYFKRALSTNEAAFKAFEEFSYSHKKEYIEWIEGAKTEDTRNKRIATALEWLAEGKSRNWKYTKK